MYCEYWSFIDIIVKRNCVQWFYLMEFLHEFITIFRHKSSHILD